MSVEKICDVFEAISSGRVEIEWSDTSFLARWERGGKVFISQFHFPIRDGELREKIAFAESEGYLLNEGEAAFAASVYLGDEVEISHLDKNSYIIRWDELDPPELGGGHTHKYVQVSLPIKVDELIALLRQG